MSNDELPDVPSLRVVEPPPDGLVRLRAAIEADGERRTSRRRWIFATVPVAVVVAILLLRRDRDRGEFELARTPEPVAVADPAIAPTFYWVASTPGRTTALPERPVTYGDPPGVTARAP